MLYSKNLFKLPIIEALSENIESVLRGAIKFENINVITPK
tara:strand:- start:445 stop:564 length:120 start_codon:yes stop_codon:yes gene_type:complete